MTKRPPRVPVLLSNETPTRGSFSHVTFICDDPTVQPLLPQVILGNEHVLRKQDLDAVAATLPRNVYLIRGKSSWLDHPVLCAILKWLGRALLHLQTTRGAPAVGLLLRAPSHLCAPCGTPCRHSLVLHPSKDDLAASALRQPCVQALQIVCPPGIPADPTTAAISGGVNTKPDLHLCRSGTKVATGPPVVAGFL